MLEIQTTRRVPGQIPLAPAIPFAAVPTIGAEFFFRQSDCFDKIRKLLELQGGKFETFPDLLSAQRGS